MPEGKGLVDLAVIEPANSVGRGHYPRLSATWKRAPLATVSKMIYIDITQVYALKETRTGVTANASIEFDAYTSSPTTFLTMFKDP